MRTSFTDSGKHMTPVEHRRKWSRLVVAFGLFVAAGCGTTRINIAGNAMKPTLKMGDNRQNSADSWSWGLVRRDAIWAKVIIQ